MTSPLISAAELRSLARSIGDGARRPLPDGRAVRARRSTPSGHVPGAAYVDLDTELAAPPGAWRQAPAARTPTCSGPRHADGRACSHDRAGRGLRRLGRRGPPAGAWWLLRYARSRRRPGARRRLVGLGRRRRRGGRPSPPQPVRGRLHRPARARCPVVDASTEVLDVSRVLVDARAPERYRGETEPIDPVAGHGSPVRRQSCRPAPTSGADGRFRQPRTSCRALYEAAGVPTDGSQEVAVFCGSGVTAVDDLLALETARGDGRRSTRGAGAAGSPTPTRPVASG